MIDILEVSLIWFDLFFFFRKLFIYCYFGLKLDIVAGLIKCFYDLFVYTYFPNYGREFSTSLFGAFLLILYFDI